jgi:hypothetical protein
LPGMPREGGGTGEDVLADDAGRFAASTVACDAVNGGGGGGGMTFFSALAGGGPGGGAAFFSALAGGGPGGGVAFFSTLAGGGPGGGPGFLALSKGGVGVLDGSEVEEEPADDSTDWSDARGVVGAGTDSPGGGGGGMGVGADLGFKSVEAAAKDGGGGGGETRGVECVVVPVVPALPVLLAVSTACAS